MDKQPQYVVAYDIDDTLFSFHPFFIPWAEKQHAIDLGKPQTNDFRYNCRHPDVDIDWLASIDAFTLEASVQHMTPETGIIEHMDNFSDRIIPVAITARPKHHRRQTETLLKKYLPEFFPNLDTQLIMPDELAINGVKPTKSDICHDLKAIAFFDDAIHNINTFVESNIDTKPYIFRSEHTTWNHCDEELPEGVEGVVELPKGVEIVVGWEDASKKLEQHIHRIENGL